MENTMDPQMHHDQYVEQLEDELHRLRMQKAEQEDEYKSEIKDLEKQLEEMDRENRRLRDEIQDLAYGTHRTQEDE